MSSQLLNEYRCTCGKLLFKGRLFQCVLEIKCRRCGAMTALGLTDVTACAMIESNLHEEVTQVSGDSRSVLGCDKEYVLGKRLPDLFPLIRDAQRAASTPNAPYEIRENILMLHDGTPKRVESYVIPCMEKGNLAGYRIFSVPS